MTRFTAPLAALAAATLFAAPAAAQDAAAPMASGAGEVDDVNMVIVYGDDACPQSSADVIVVCARQAESERYRIPEALRFSENPANDSWAKRVENLEMVGDFGTLSCSPAGAGGVLGCTHQMIEAAYDDRAEGSAIRFSNIIAAAREERLSTIDADAAAEQDRVEMIEREYMQRLENEREAEVPGDLPQPGATTPEG